MTLTAAELLVHTRFTEEDFGDGVVDNLITAARLPFDLIATNQSNEARTKLCFIYYVLSKLYGMMADEKSYYVGLITQRGGQVSTPLGAYREFMQAAARNYQEARNLYPDLPWPPLDGEASGGSVTVPRTYAS